jgi:hypothetical protein
MGYAGIGFIAGFYRQESFDDPDTTALLYFSCSLQENTCLARNLLPFPV